VDAPDSAGSARADAMRPAGVHDLRAAPTPLVLQYGPSDVLVVAGLPGAGKTTLMSRCVQAPVIDSRHTRLRYQARIPRWLPYRLVRPVVRIAHCRRLFAALRAGGPLVVHDFGAVPLVRSCVARYARRQGRDAHLLIVDVDPDTAWAAQIARGRSVPPARFARHRGNAQRMLRQLSAGSPPPAWKSATILSRSAARSLDRIVFA
jgi:hypothetical protein